MGGTVKIAEQEAISLFKAIGAFLTEHRLSPDPAHYSFAHQVLSDPNGPLAQAVARLTDGGVRLMQQDIVELGGVAVPGRPITLPDPDHHSPDPAKDAAMVVARTEQQMSSFAATVRSIHAETSGFGRDLAASAAAMRQADPAAALDHITHLTGIMIERVHDAERRLAAAESETNALREALEEARGTARRDPLTDLANRRAFDEAFAAVPPNTPVVIALCDIDHFKRVNDEFGHAVGDRVLRAVGQTLASEGAEAGALVARYGGEEFAFLMTDIGVTAARTVIERARSAVAGKRFRSRETDMPIGEVTISAGIAGGHATDAREALYARADAALYRAKAAGRNRVLFAA
ncbi:GGDEF domain-containing protein [Sphingomonas jeddahensis]|uniref:diguanylate cyclase n=1 Tax=Sphingomonas jeddahensis TaxID=1915074 RepID=A0A1V2EV63_9SPHN|nr:GGDEF domain-containing protein [Sphingomonas jeddahensis]ONF96562.1 putative diguanylate cyclase YcdT [Sphingomonas jeddahensis]